MLAKDMNLNVVMNEDNPSAYKSDIIVHSTTPSVYAPELDSTKERIPRYWNQWTLISHLGGNI